MQKYCVGTIISKEFEVPGQRKLRRYRGEVQTYYPEHQLYLIVYEDGDSEEMEEEYVTRYLDRPNNDEFMAAMAASPPRSQWSSVADIASVSPSTDVMSKKIDGCGGVVAPLERGCSLADVFDKSDDDSDGDGDMNQVPEIVQLPKNNNWGNLWSEAGGVDATNISGCGVFADAHTHAGINLNINTSAAEKPEQQHPKISLETLLRSEQQNGGKKDKNKFTNVPTKKRKARALPSRRHQEVGKSRRQDDNSEALSNPSDEIKFSSVRSSKKKRRRSKSTTGAVLARTTRLAPKGANANTDHKINSANDTEQLSVGDTVYAAWWNTKKNVKAYTMFRGIVKAAKFDELSQRYDYDVAFDDGKYLAGIDQSVVISEHRYLNENLKPVSTIPSLVLQSSLKDDFRLPSNEMFLFCHIQLLKVGQRVVAGWWEDPNDTSAPPVGWFPGVINACRQLKQGGLLGPDRFYDIDFDDGDALDDIEDIFVFPKSEYDLLGREARGASRWKGVENVLSEESNDRYAQTVGYWVVKGAANKRFPFLGDALRFYDDLIVSDKGAKVEKADLNLPEDWDIDSDGKYLPKRSSLRSLSNDSSLEGISGETNVPSVMLQTVSPAPTKLIPSGVICLRGNFVQEKRNGMVIRRITGLWSTGLDKILADPENRLGGCGYFEYDQKQESSCNKSSAAEDVSFPSGRYSGFFDVPSGGLRTKIKEDDIVFNFVENNEGYYNVEGRGSNEFGKYTMSGTLSKEGVITFQRHYLSGAVRLDTVPQGKPLASHLHADERLRSSCSSVSIDAERIIHKGSESVLDIEKTGNTTKSCAQTQTTLSEECQTNGKKGRKKIIRNRVTPSPPLLAKAQSSAASEQIYKTPSSTAYPTATKTDLQVQAVEATDLPTGWRIRTVPRKTGKASDRYFYSPKLNIRFRSKVEVVRFLDCLTKHQGDEEKAWSALEKQKAKPVTSQMKRKRPSAKPSADAIREPSADAAVNKERRSSTRSTDGSSSCPQRKITIVEYVKPSSPRLELSEEETRNSKIQGINEADKLSTIHPSPNNKRTKPTFHRGEKVYAVLSGNDPWSEGSKEWFPGRIWDFKVKMQETSYGPVKVYDISEYEVLVVYLFLCCQFLAILTSQCPAVFDDGEVARDLDEIWVMKEEDYKVLSAKPNEFSWIGVQRFTDRSTNDEYARTVGWYETYLGGEHQIYTSISDAMKSYDKVSI